jgi:hypothetical protein
MSHFSFSLQKTRFLERVSYFKNFLNKKNVYKKEKKEVQQITDLLLKK